MSHTSTVKSVPIRDVGALKAAVAELRQSIGCRLEENTRPRAYYSDQIAVCPYVLRLDNSRYDVGFVLQADGSYLPQFDDWGGDIGRQIGAQNNRLERDPATSIGRLSQLYTKHSAINAAIAQGYLVESCEQDAAGNLQLTVAGF